MSMSRRDIRSRREKDAGSENRDIKTWRARRNVYFVKLFVMQNVFNFNGHLTNSPRMKRYPELKFRSAFIGRRRFKQL